MFIINKIKQYLFIRPARFVRHYSGWFAIVLVLALVAGAYFYGKYSVYQAHPELYRSEQAQSALKKVGTLIQLPNGVPTMVTINNAEAVKKQQPFLKNAKDGDILIIYQKASQVILYRPSTNRLIAVGPITSANSKGIQKQAKKQTTSSNSSKIKISTPETTTTKTEHATTTTTNK